MTNISVLLFIWRYKVFGIHRVEKFWKTGWTKKCPTTIDNIGNTITIQLGHPVLMQPEIIVINPEHLQPLDKAERVVLRIAALIPDITTTCENTTHFNHCCSWIITCTQLMAAFSEKIVSYHYVTNTSFLDKRDCSVYGKKPLQRH